MIWTILLAAGQGTRLAAATGGLPKQFLDYEGTPLYWQSALLFARCARIRGLVFVFPAEVLEQERERVALLLQKSGLGLAWRAVSGGSLRQDSVRNGLEALPRECTQVLVHDTARPFATPRLVNQLLDGLHTMLSEGEAGGVIPGIPVTDTIKVLSEQRVVSTPDRASLVAVQTPQVFAVSALRAAHARALEEQWVVTDDASVLERAGYPVVVLPGEAGNKKITTLDDLDMVNAQQSLAPCVGYGYDVHKYATEETSSRQPARPLRLGGIALAEGPQVFAHSDGDVLLHAVMDALLGCAGLGDIGQLFPDADAAFDNIDSAVLLDDVLERLRQKEVQLVHLDVTLIAQLPKVAPHREAIRRNLCRLLNLESVNLKATTEEGLGFTGEGKGIKAVAVATAWRKTL